MWVPNKKYFFFPVFFLSVFLFCFSNPVFGAVNFTMYVQPQTAINANPVFTLRRQRPNGQWISRTIRSGETIRIASKTWELTIPLIDGCTMASYVEQIAIGNSATSKTVTYNCASLNYFIDADGDGYGDPNNPTANPLLGVNNDADCDDTDANEKPGQTWYKDLDGDGYSDDLTQTDCARPASYKLLAELQGLDDCNDNDAGINPVAMEICNDGIDQNCDPTDNECGATFYLDADQDAYGDPDTTVIALLQPDGYVANDDDCDDNDDKEYPGQTWYKDIDDDGYSDGTTLIDCQRPVNYKAQVELTAVSGDCDDGDGSRYPGAAEVCEDSIDQDCDGSDATCTADTDSDGSPADEDCNDNVASIHPGAVEIPNDGIDQDCDGADATALTCVDIADTPLDTQLAASAPNLMFGLDDSGSMDWEIMTGEEVGLFEVSGRDYEYIFADPGDNLYTSGTNSHILYDEGKQAYWRSQWHEYNVIYYNPGVDYEPWRADLGDADPDNPRSHPWYAANYFDLSAVFFTIDATNVPNAHYYVWSESENKPYLVVIDNNRIDYYRVNDSNGIITTGELVNTVTPPNDISTGKTYTEARQNFANWYSYYRKRRSVSIAAIGNVIPKLKGVMVGIRSINAQILQKVLPIAVNGVDRTNEILDKLFSYHAGNHTTGSTPIRKGLQKIGKYYHVNETITPAEAELSVSPLEDDASGECQQNFAIMFTDGAYNGQSPGLGNVDDDMPAPYGDAASNTLADVAINYWQEDLAPDIDNNVPTNFYDSANWQHMVTYTVAFGVEGNLDPDDYDLDNIVEADRVYPTWPSPINSDKKRIDDLWHTAVNGRGLYLNAKTPQELISAIEKVISDVLARIGSGASVSINGEELQDGLILYQSIYSTNRWTGDVIAYNVDEDTGAVDRQNPRWSATDVLDTSLNAIANYWDTGRIIATYDNSLAVPAGIPFRFNELSTTQKTVLTSSDMLDYLRGNHVLEEQKGGTFRSRFLQDENGNYVRDTALADVVHSAPLYYKTIVFVGGNDGMLHAFDSDDGRELFAYVPDLVFDNLGLLVDPNYTHRYYVDLTPFARYTGTKDLLVGGLGKGGKGYYCLDITNAKTAITTESELAAKVMWEYPNHNTPADEVADLGDTFSKAVIVNTYSTDGWAVIFGNGYNSPNNDAALYIVDADSGELIRKINTGANSACNGLATPLAIDSNADGKVEYVYAGDLQGNLWKFDLTSSNSSEWDVAYKTGTTAKSLFQAKDAHGNTQPITVKPDAMFHCDKEKPGFIVAFGTGRYLGSSDLTDTNQQTLYGVWDYGDDSDNSEYLGSFERGSNTSVLFNQPATVSLLMQETVFNGVINSVTYRILSDNEAIWKTQDDGDTPPENTILYPNPSSSEDNHAGWYFDLPDEKERIVRDLVIRGGKVILITSIPQSSSPCVAGGESYLMEVNACTGARTTSPQLDINDDGKIDDQDLISTPNPDPNGDPIYLPPTGLKYPTMMFPPMIIDNPNDDTELKYFSTSAGNVIIMKEQDEGEGPFYWRQLDE